MYHDVFPASIMYIYMIILYIYMYTSLKTDIVSENGWLGSMNIPFKNGSFSGSTCESRWFSIFHPTWGDDPI